MNRFNLERKQVPTKLLHGYTGKSIVVEVCESVSIPADAGTWSGGTREMYTAVRLSDGEMASVTDTFSTPWDADRRTRNVTLRPGFAILETGTFCGRDAGLHYYLHPIDAAPMLPAPAPALSNEARKVLEAICSLISSARADEYRRNGLADADIERAKSELFAGGYIDKRGAVTVSGRNARRAAL